MGAFSLHMGVSVSALQETVKDWHAAVHGVTKNRTQLGLKDLGIHYSCLKYCVELSGEAK